MPSILDLAKQILPTSTPAPEVAVLRVAKTGKGDAESTGTAPWTDAELLDLHRECKTEAFDQRWVFLRQWTRNIYYILGRQWIEYNSKDGQWKDKRLAKWIPRPVTNKCKETVQAIRAMFTSIELSATCRPNGNDPKNISAANTADQLAPVLHDNHDMDQVMNEADFWFLVTGNAFLHTYWDYDPQYGMIESPVEECVGCGYRASVSEVQGAQPVCPECQGNEFQPAMEEDGITPAVQRKAKGKSVTDGLSPFEFAFPNAYPVFNKVPYVYRLRWRTKRYYEDHPTLNKYVSQISWVKSPEDRSLQIFKSLSLQNDLGLSPTYWSEASGSGDQELGIPEYELWYKPCDKYPDGLLVRFAGENNPLVIHLEDDEAIPGPFPYTDVKGNPLFPFQHMGYDAVGGRVLASGAIDPIIQKQDQLNQLDSMIQMIIQRMANPIWLEPKGAEVEKFTGEPGLVVKWNPLTVNGNAKPERIAGEGPHGSFFQIRDMYLKDIEELTGTFDVVKGAKPTGVEAFSALNLLVERSQARFASAFKSRASAYAGAFKIQLELQRAFGPDEITKALLSPARTYTFQTFKNSELQGDVSVIVESGASTPKTNLGTRAAVEHLNQLGMIDATDPDQKYKIFQLFGQSDLSPSLDIHVQAALQKQQAFEEWIANPSNVQMAAQQAEQKFGEYQQKITMDATSAVAAGQQPAPPGEPPSALAGTPLKWRRWYNPIIHRQEFMKWANSDAIRELVQTNPQAEGLLEAHLMEMEIALAESQQGMVGGASLSPDAIKASVQPPQPPGGAGGAMKSSNSNSGHQSGQPPQQGAA